MRALEVDGVYVQPSLRDVVTARQEARIEETVAAIPYPVKVVVLRPDTDDREPGAVLSRIHEVALRDRTVDPAAYLGVDLESTALSAREFDVTTPVGLAIPVAAERAPGEVGRQLVITTRLLADSRAERAYDRLVETAGPPVGSAAVRSAPPAPEQPQAATLDVPAVLITLAVLLAALVSVLWARRSRG